MKLTRVLILLILSIAALRLGSGCASLPDVNEVIDEAPTAVQSSHQIVSSKGLLSPQKSKAIMERLKNSVNSTKVDP
jgi:cardiolipin synthase